MKNVFVIGDSISLQYGEYLEGMLKNRFVYDRKEGKEEAMKNLDIPAGANGGDSSQVLTYLKAKVKKDVFQPDYLLLNCGLHDLRVDPETDKRQLDLEEYRNNLNQILELLNHRKISTIWMRTTPVDDATHNYEGMKFFRYNADVIAYNKVADEVFANAKCPIMDLYTFTLNLAEDLYCDHTHFKDNVREKQAAFIAGFLEGLSQDRTR